MIDKAIKNIDNFRIGFELEYQNSDLEGESELDDDLCTEARDQLYSDTLGETIRSCVSSVKFSRIKSDAWNTERYMNKINDLVTEQLTEEYEDLDEDEDKPTLDDYLKDNWDDKLDVVFTSEVRDLTWDEAIDLDVLGSDALYDWVYDNVEYDDSCYTDSADLDLPSLLERVSDGSVSGGEIRPTRGLSLSECNDTLKALERDYDFEDDLEVNNECSFHVHLSVRGISHSYGSNVQYHMMQYISDNIDRCPNGCLERWGAKNRRWLGRYFNIKLYSPTISRYCFVQYSPRHGTWEFRGFGGVLSAKEGMDCINLAIEAYKYAIKRRHKYPTKSIAILSREIMDRSDAEMRKRERRKAKASQARLNDLMAS